MEAAPVSVHVPTEKTVQVVPVSHWWQLRRFIDFPYRLYRDYPYWIPPLRRDVAETLNPRKNPFFEHGKIQPFLALDAQGHTVGRIAAIVNGMHLKKYKDGVGFFGFFECVPDFSVAQALFEAAARWLRHQGLTHMRGPANPSLNEVAGLLIEGFDRAPSILMPYNPPYYAAFLEQAGFTRVMTMWAYYVHKKYVKTEKLERGVELVRRRNPSITLRTLDLSRFDEEARTVLDIYNEAWSDNWGHVPMTENEFQHMARAMRKVVDPELVFILEDAGRPIAFSLLLPNLNQALRHVRNGRLLPFGLIKLLLALKLGAVYETRMPLMGIRKAYHGRGLDALLVLETIQRGKLRGYEACEMSWVLDTNKVLLNALVHLGAVVDKAYALYEKPL
jgi:GNAT superfamily N-acetyltransferase